MAASLAGLAFLAVTSAALLSPLAVVGQLRTDYYSTICPNLETIVRSSVKQSMAASPISAPATLRLFFHDCAVRGCDASIMIVNSNGDDEWRNSDNQSLKPEGFTTVLNAKAAVDSDPQCRYKVSCADILALAARESVYQSGGPNYQVELGRYDGRVSTRDSVVLPHANFNLDQLNAFFAGLGLSQTDMIALSGGHTFGAADCRFFQYRIGADPAMDQGFAAQLRNTCGGNPNNFAFLDGATPAAFDNAYYRGLQQGRGLLGSDQALHADQRSRGTVDYYAWSQSAFFGDFAAAMTRLGRVGVKTAATGGEIRRDCRFPN
ncbi:peroxidase 45-like [Oryza glaberrima]|uniref:Peroxidase n=2 Tax=Oryza TaxID=4527 RepID=A0A0D3GKA8_9ORYZ|nr:peroxidase 45-like [Oryza glaberrima]